MRARQTDRHTDTLIAMLCTPPWSDVMNVHNTEGSGDGASRLPYKFVVGR